MPSSLATAHEVTTGLGTSVATEPPRVAEVVVYTCTALALDRILSMRTGGSMTPLYASPFLPSLRPHHRFCLFSSADVQPFVPQLLDVLLAAQNSPEHTVENDFLSCVVRVPSAHCVLCLIGVLPRSCESFHHYETSARWGVRQRSVEARRHPTRSRPKSEYPQL